MMRINDIKYGINPYQHQINRPKTNPNTASGGDVVDISANGKEIYQAMKSDQADRQKRIEQLKQQISAGTYKIDSQKVADKMIEFWQK